MNGEVFAAAILAIATIVAAVVTARSAKRSQSDVRERRLMRRQIEDLQADMLTLKGHTFRLRAIIADLGAQPPDVPRLRSEEWE